MATLRYSPDELIEALKRTRIKTIVVEGGDDLEILRDLEARLSKTVGSVDFCVAGDKTTVLGIWQHRESLPKTTVGFLADSDLWLFDNKRQDFSSVVFTNGYSIENICFGSQSLQDLINARPPTKQAWDHALGGLIDWFSSEAAYYLNGSNPFLDIGIHQILDVGGAFDLIPEATARVQAAPQQLFAVTKELVQESPYMYIRGKQLFLALSEILSRHEGNRISLKSLKTIGSRTPNSAIEELIMDLSNSFV